MKNKTIIPLNCLDLGDGGIHLMLRMKVNRVTARMVLDTGASKTIFDKTRFERFIANADMTKNDVLSAGLGTSSVESHTVEIKRIRIGDLIFEDYDGVVMDLAHINQAYQEMGMKPLDGILGSDILYQYEAVIDYGKLKLTLSY